MVGIRDDKPHNLCEQPVSGKALPLDVDLGHTHGIASGRGVSIAIIDTGSATPTSRGDRDHCILHGTAVATVAGTIAPGAVVTAYRHSERPEDSDGTVKTLVRAIDRAVRDNNQIINISMVACSDTTEMREAIGRAVKSGALVVASAGNKDQCEPGQAAYPAALPQVMSIGAVEQRANATPNPPPSPNPDAGTVPADYSMPADHIDLYAPGGPVSAKLRTSDGTTHTIVGNPAPFQGTSFASPIVAGTAALLWELWPDATPSQIRSLLENTAIPGGADSATTQPVKVIAPARAVHAAVEKVAATREDLARGDGAADRAADGPEAGGGAASNGITDHAHAGRSNHAPQPGFATTVTAQPPVPEVADYRVPLGLAMVLALAVIAAVVARALASESNPPSGNAAINRHGT